jgi:CheY-like chemotaxis protein
MAGNEQDWFSVRSILLVEDEKDHAEMIRRLFEDDSPKWNITHISDLAEALKCIENGEIDLFSLVIADYRLTDGVGLDLVKGAKSPKDVGFPLIILTAVGSEQLAVKALKSGVMDYVVKSSNDLQQLPRTANRVIQEWNSIIERQRIEDDLKDYIRDLEHASDDLEDFFDRISEDLEHSLSEISASNDILLENYADKLDDVAMDYLYKSRDSAERASKMIEGLFGRLLPIYLDSFLINLYSKKMEEIKLRS